MFLINTAGPRAHALEEWREPARAVSECWAAFLDPEPVTRRWAFASYVAALDAEEVAATELAALAFRMAA
jgi:hypothetical protein